MSRRDLIVKSFEIFERCINTSNITKKIIENLKKNFELIVIDKLIIQITILCIEFFDKSITFVFAFV